jgi:hypothetical protein
MLMAVLFYFRKKKHRLFCKIIRVSVPTKYTNLVLVSNNIKWLLVNTDLQNIHIKLKMDVTNTEVIVYGFRSYHKWIIQGKHRTEF